MALRTMLVTTLRALLVAALVPLALVTGAASAQANTAPSVQGVTIQGDNSQASVDGVDGVRATGDGKDCAYLRVCLYTGPNMTGTRFDLYQCGDYRLVQWNGAGSVWNNQTTGTTAVFMNRQFTVIGSVRGRDSNGTIYGYTSYDFSPVWYVRPC
ncbi:peptidase inhibitor family I36 protein [Streptomyces sp. NPDC001108]